MTLRDDAFTVTGGDVTRAERRDRNSAERNRAWTITVEPASASATVKITLPETTDCGATGAICTGDGRKLSNSTAATVNAASSSSNDVARGTVAEDDLAVVEGLTPDEAAAALFGERSLGEAELAALDRLGNRNGSFDLGDALSWIDRCRRGDADCGGTSGGSGPVGAAALPAAARGGGTSGRTGGRAPGRRPGVRRVRRRQGSAPYALAVLLAAVMTWSCTDGSPAPTAPAATVPDPGILTLEWTGPAAGRDIGVLLELEGPGIEAVHAPGLELYESSTPGPHRIVVAGDLRPGPLVHLRVPDRGRLAEYRVRVIEVTGEDYGLRDAGDYRAAIRSY